MWRHRGWLRRLIPNSLRASAFGQQKGAGMRRISPLSAYPPVPRPHAWQLVRYCMVTLLALRDGLNACVVAPSRGVAHVSTTNPTLFLFKECRGKGGITICPLGINMELCTVHGEMDGVIENKRTM